MIRVLLHLLDQPVNLARLGLVGRNGDGLAFAAEGVEGGAGFFAGLRFARGDEDLGAAGLEEASQRHLLSAWFGSAWEHWFMRTQKQRADPILASHR